MSVGTAQNGRRGEPLGQVGGGARQPDREPVAARADPGDVARLAGDVGGGADHVGQVLLAGRSRPPWRMLLRGLRLRSIVCLKVSAVTGWFEGGEKRMPGRITNVYERPPSLTVGAARAASGTSRSPASPGSSG